MEESSGTVLISSHDGVPKALVMRVRKRPLYEIPKGHIEDGETPQQAAVRELREETNVEVPLTLGDYLGDVEYRFRSFGRHVHKRVQYFVATPSTDDQPTFRNTSKVIREILWVTREEAADMKWVSADLHEIVLKAFDMAPLQPDSAAPSN